MECYLRRSGSGFLESGVPVWNPGLRLLDFGLNQEFMAVCIEHRLSQAFLQMVICLALRGVLLALRVPACARESLGTLPAAIYIYIYIYIYMI